MAESFLYHIVNRPNADLGDLSILDMVLECVGNHDYEVSLSVACSSQLSTSPPPSPPPPSSPLFPSQVAEITFNVWYRLSEELTKINDNQLTEVFRPYIHKLVSHLCVHCQLDEDTSPVSPSSITSLTFFILLHFRLLYLKRMTTFQSFVIKSLSFCEMLSSWLEPCLSFPRLLKRCLYFVLSNMPHPLPHSLQLYRTICTPGTAWNVTEACLFVMQSIAGFIPL